MGKMRGRSRGVWGQKLVLASTCRADREFRRTRTIIVAIIALISLVATSIAAVSSRERVDGAPSPMYTWSTEMLNSFGEGDSAIDITSDGTPWVAFFDGVSLDLVLAHRSPGTGCTNANWTCEVVDGSGDCGGSPCDAGRSVQMKIDSSDRVHLAWRNQTAISLQYAVKSGPIWTRTELASGGNGKYPTGLAFGSGDVPHIAYAHDICCEAGLIRPVAVGANCGGGLWNCSGFWSSNSQGIVVEPTGRVDISYAAFPGGKAAVAYPVPAGSGNCGQWNDFSCNEVTTGSAGELVLNGATPELVYFSPGLRLARYVGSGGTGCDLSTAWSCFLIDNRDEWYGHDIAVDGAGREHIAYTPGQQVSVASNEGAATAAPCTNTDWHCDDIAFAQTDPSIAINSSQYMHVSFSDGTSIFYTVSVEQIPIPEAASLLLVSAAMVPVALWIALGCRKGRTRRIRCA